MRLQEVRNIICFVYLHITIYNVHILTLSIMKGLLYGGSDKYGKASFSSKVISDGPLNISC